VGYLAEENALIHPEQVTGAPDHSGGARMHRSGAPEGSAQDQEFTDEAVEQRESDGGQYGDEKEGAYLGMGVASPPTR